MSENMRLLKPENELLDRTATNDVELIGYGWLGRNCLLNLCQQLRHDFPRWPREDKMCLLGDGRHVGIDFHQNSLMLPGKRRQSGGRIDLGRGANGEEEVTVYGRRLRRFQFRHWQILPEPHHVWSQ